MKQSTFEPERLDALAGMSRTPHMPHTPHTPHMPRTPHRPTVLVVDDEPGIVDLLCEFLEGAGYRALFAGNGRSALAIARRERPALVITDRNMPGIDGVDLMRRLHSSPMTNNIPVIIMSSARPSDGDGTEYVPFLAKPFDLDDMLATVAAYAGPPDGR